MSELKVCAYCGHEAARKELRYYGETETWAYCPNPDCPMHDRTMTIKAWQTRPIEDALLARAEKAEAENATLKEERRWIPVREQMPTSGTQWVLLKNGKMDFDFTYIDGGRYDWWRNGSNVTHWMPLPEPPEVTE